MWLPVVLPKITAAPGNGLSTLHHNADPDLTREGYAVVAFQVATTIGSRAYECLASEIFHIYFDLRSAYRERQLNHSWGGFRGEAQHRVSGLTLVIDVSPQGSARRPPVESERHG